MWFPGPGEYHWDVCSVLTMKSKLRDARRAEGSKALASRRAIFVPRGSDIDTPVYPWRVESTSVRSTAAMLVSGLLNFFCSTVICVFF